MTNHRSSHANRFNPRVLNGGVNGHGIPEPPGGLPIIGKREMRINGLELVGMFSQQMMQLPAVSGISDGIIATISARGAEKPTTAEESYTLKLIDALAAYQRAAREIVAAEVARVKVLDDAAANAPPENINAQPPTAEDLLLP